MVIDGDWLSVRPPARDWQLAVIVGDLPVSSWGMYGYVLSKAAIVKLSTESHYRTVLFRYNLVIPLQAGRQAY